MNAKDLRIGDRIRFLRMPPKYFDPEYGVPPETMALYELLIATGDTLEVVDFLDGYPITSYTDNRDPHEPHGHALVIDEIDDGCWELVARSERDENKPPSAQ
jgi:hypothetical protein